jgi:hypothetical protein
VKTIFTVILAMILFSSPVNACLPQPRGALFDEEILETASVSFIGTVTEKISSATTRRTVFHVDQAIKNVKQGENYIASKNIECGLEQAGDIWLIFSLPEISCSPKDSQSPQTLQDVITAEDKTASCLIRKERPYAAYLLWSKNDFKREQVKDLLIQVKNKFGYELPAYALENPRDEER